MANEHDPRRLADLLVDPHETLDVELKGWIDIVGNNDHKATLAKALIALANHGGGFVVIGFEATDHGVRPAANRPATLAAYTPDTVNAIVLGYAEPTFHCDVAIVTGPDNLTYPIVAVPGGHKVPIRSRRDGPDGQIVRQNNYYIRRPGPQSESPQSGQEWDGLIRRSIANAREELLNQLRTIIAGGVGGEAPETDLQRLARWFDASFRRWRELVDPLPDGSLYKLPLGHYAVAYQIVGTSRPPRPADLLEMIDRATVRHTGWPQFWVPRIAELRPYVQDGNIECWIGRDGQARDVASADYWRVSPEGQAFLIRGYKEDAMEDRGPDPGTVFSITLPTWRVGELLLHAANLARELGDPQSQVSVVVQWTGLNRRRLSAFGTNRLMFDNHASHQDRYRQHLSVQADQINDNLPELVSQLVTPLYELFDFFVLPATLIPEELTRMRQNRLYP